MAKANSYKLKEGVTVQDLQNKGFTNGSWQSKYNNIECMNRTIKLTSNIELDLTIKTNPMKFDDFEDVLVLDSSFCQPYTPFYGSNYKNDVTNFGFLEEVIDMYNYTIDRLGLFNKNFKECIKY